METTARAVGTIVLFLVICYVATHWSTWLLFGVAAVLALGLLYLIDRLRHEWKLLNFWKLHALAALVTAVAFGLLSGLMLPMLGSHAPLAVWAGSQDWGCCWSWLAQVIAFIGMGVLVSLCSFGFLGALMLSVACFDPSL